jgi:hypothetical protein
MRSAQNLNQGSLNEMAEALEKLNKLEDPGGGPSVLRNSEWIPILNNAALAGSF